jgi:hypothetical protein
VDWSKLDPRASIKFVESLDPSATVEDFSELEILNGSIKPGGALQFKLDTEKAILEQFKKKKEESEKLRTKGRF